MEGVPSCELYPFPIPGVGHAICIVVMCCRVIRSVRRRSAVGTAPRFVSLRCFEMLCSLQVAGKYMANGVFPAKITLKGQLCDGRMIELGAVP